MHIFYTTLLFYFHKLPTDRLRVMAALFVSSWNKEFYEALEDEKLNQLYSKIAEEGLQENFTQTAYMRYLTACNDDVAKACLAMQENVKWRRKMSVDTLSFDSCPNEVAKRYAIIGEGKVDKFGRPVIYNIIRRHNKYQRDIAEAERFIICNMEQTIRRANPLEEKIAIVMDLNGFGLINMDYELVAFLIRILQEHYRECMFRVFVLDAPWIFSACWVIIKPWLDPRTAQKVIFVKKEELDEFVDRSLFESDLQDTP